MSINIRLLSLATLVLAAACTKHAKDDEESKAPPPVVEVKVDSLILGNVEDAVTAAGRTDVLRKEIISAPAAGKVLSVKVTEGTPVKAGEIVATLRPKESESVIDGAETMLRQAKTADEKKEAQHALDLALATQSVLNLKAKLNGVVSSRMVQEGNLVNENESLLTVLNLSTLDFQAEVPLTESPKIKVNLPAAITLQALPGRAFPAEVATLSPQANSANQTFSAMLRFKDAASQSNRTLLKADMAGEARIILSTRKGVLLAPAKALLRNDENQSYTLTIVGGDSLAHVIPVKAGAAQGDRREVSGEGLTPGMQVVIEGQYGLADSTKVRIAQ